MKKVKRIWSDMDGVVAIYEREVYIGDYSPNALEQDKPKFLKEPGYFRTCKPDKRMIKALEILTERRYDIHILTNIAESNIEEFHKLGKLAWLQEHMPFINVSTNFHAIEMAKYRYIESTLARPLTNTDILISDFNEDVKPWTSHGGTGIKYLNSINSADSYNGANIPLELKPDGIADFIENIIDSLT